MKKSILIAAVLLSPFLALAQAEPGSALPMTPEAEIMLDAGKDAQELLEEFLESKGWIDGDNVKSDGSVFSISVGVGVIAAPPKHPSYNASRARAFDKAMLDAKASMIKKLEQTILTSMEFSDAEANKNTTPTPEEQMAVAINKMPSDSLCKKAVNLISRKLDKALKEEGVDIAQEKSNAQGEYDAARAKAESLKRTTEFRKSTASAASCALSGIQAFYTVEVQNAKGNGEIGVIAIWSPTLAEMATSLVNGRPVMSKLRKRPIKEQLPKDKAKLLATFGVQQMINEKGEYVLVAFAQDAAITGSTQAAKAAYDKARQRAEAQIRTFAGEIVATNGRTDEAEKSLEYGGESESTIDYNDMSSYENFQKSSAAAMKCNGIQTVKKWKAPHPISGRMVYGTICTWSPSQAEGARAMKKQIESTATDGANGVRTNAPTSTKSLIIPKPVSDHNLGEGAAGDGDAF